MLFRSKKVRQRFMAKTQGEKIMDSLKEWIKDRLPERTTWDGAVCIGLGLLVLFITPLAKIAAGAVIVYGAWTIWKGE